MCFHFQGKGDRAYIVSSGSNFQQVNLTQRVVAGLIGFNAIGFRDALAYDVKFIKVLLVACIGRRNIENGKLNSLAVKFIKGNFSNNR